MAKKKKVGRPILNEVYNVPKGKKICGNCLEVKSISEFHKHKRLKDGLQPQCKQSGKKAVYKHRAENREHYRQKDRDNYAKDPERTRKRQRDWRDKQLSGPNAEEFKARSKEINRKRVLRQHGLTPEQFDRMLAEQNNQCAICGSEDPKHWCENLLVDHDHKTDEVRGLLCSNCNRAVGLMDDDPIHLIKAALYLLKHDGDRKMSRRLQSLLN